MESVSDTSAPGPVPGNGRLILALIAGIPVTVILAASWLWYFVVNGELDIVGELGTANSGELLRPPRQARDAGWRSAEGQAFQPVTPPKWVLVVPQREGRCAAACESRLYETRQIHMALGKTMGRVARALVTAASPGELVLAADTLSDERPVPGTMAQYLDRDQRGMSVWYSSEAAFGDLFPELEEQPDSWYLMDPAGWVMMRYDPSISYKDVIADLKFLLKNSNG